MALSNETQYGVIVVTAVICMMVGLFLGLTAGANWFADQSRPVVSVTCRNGIPVYVTNEGGVDAEPAAECP